MKVFSLVASIVLTFLILILAFGNIAAQFSQMNFLFWQVPDDFSATVIILLISSLGIITGMFYHSLIRGIFGSAEEDEEGGF